MIDAGPHLTAPRSPGLPRPRRYRHGCSDAGRSLEERPCFVLVAAAHTASLSGLPRAMRALSASLFATSCGLRSHCAARSIRCSARAAAFHGRSSAPAIKKERPPFDMQSHGRVMLMQRRRSGNSLLTRPAVASRMDRKAAGDAGMPAGAADLERHRCELIERASAARMPTRQEAPRRLAQRRLRGARPLATCGPGVLPNRSGSINLTAISYDW